MKYAQIIGWGKYVPAKIVTNDDLALTLATSDSWIRERTGIGARRVAADNESTSTMATQAAINALDAAGINASQLDLIIVATSTPENFFPSVACLVQDALGADKAGSYDLSAACSGFVYALSNATDAIKSGSAQYVLVIGAETFSRIVDWTDRNTCILFGDGAGAVVLQASDQPGGVLSTVLHSDGSGGDLLCVSANGNGPQSTAQLAGPGAMNDTHFVHMNGREVFKFATRAVDRIAREVMHKSGWQTEQVDIVIPHQANSRIIDAAAKSLGVPVEKWFCNLEHYGNTSAASIPIALTEAAEAGRLHPNDKMMLIGFGGGLTWAAAAVQWSAPRAQHRTQRVVNRVGYGFSGLRSRARKMLRKAEDRVFGTIDPALKIEKDTKKKVAAPAPAKEE